MAILSRWRYGFESRWGDPDSKLTRSSGSLKHRRSSFDSNTVHFACGAREACLRGARVTQYLCAGSGGQNGPQNRSGWFKSICALAGWCKGKHTGPWIRRYRFDPDGRFVSFVQWKGQRISNPPIQVRALYETYGHVAKRLCDGLLIRSKQVRSPLRFGRC